MQPFQAQVERLCGIPGVDLLTAWTLIAELGADMSVFPDAAHAASWAGLCPGNRESAGKRLSSRMKKGNRWVRRALCQAAWAVTRKRNCHLTALFCRLTARLGVKKAIVAVAHIKASTGNWAGISLTSSIRSGLRTGWFGDWRDWVCR